MSRVFLVASSAAGIIGIVYCLSKRQPASPAVAVVEELPGKPKIDDITKEQVQEILQEIIKSKVQMQKCMRDLVKGLRAKPLSFEETYQKVNETAPVDPLEKSGLSTMEFDQLLEKYQTDANIRESIAKIMGASPASQVPEKVQRIEVKTIIQVHTFMLEELKTLVAHFQDVESSKESYDMKSVTIAAQILISAKIEEKFDISAEDVESAVLMHHTMLATDGDFSKLNIEIQHTMGKLMGTPFNPS